MRETQVLLRSAYVSRFVLGGLNRVFDKDQELTLTACNCYLQQIAKHLPLKVCTLLSSVETNTSPTLPSCYLQQIESICIDFSNYCRFIRQTVYRQTLYRLIYSVHSIQFSIFSRQQYVCLLCLHCYPLPPLRMFKKQSLFQVCMSSYEVLHQKSLHLVST